MSTRCNVEIYDSGRKLPKHREYLGAILYHHSDGYPSFMMGKLTRFLKAAYKMSLSESRGGWDSERVAACLVFLSVQDYQNPRRPNKLGMPYFQPCLNLHGDIDYVYRVYLEPGGKFEIVCVPASTL